MNLCLPALEIINEHIFWNIFLTLCNESLTRFFQNGKTPPSPAVSIRILDNVTKNIYLTSSGTVCVYYFPTAIFHYRQQTTVYIQMRSCPLRCRGGRWWRGWGSGGSQTNCSLLSQGTMSIVLTRAAPVYVLCPARARVYSQRSL